MSYINSYINSYVNNGIDRFRSHRE